MVRSRMRLHEMVVCIAVVLFGIGLQGRAADPADRGAFQTVVKVSELDPATYAEWVAGREENFPSQDPNDRALQPKWVIWTQDGETPGHSGRSFGDNKTPGVRHMRIGFTEVKAVGAILAVGNIKVSVLKPSVPYPGDMGDDSQWIPAQHLAGSTIMSDEGGPDCYMWVTPPGTRTRAIRFTHTARISDREYRGWLGGAYVLPERIVNLAPQAQAVVNSSSEKAGQLNNENSDNYWGAWDNFDTGAGETARAKTIAEDPEYVTLIWPRPVTLNGLALLFTGFAAADIQVYKGAGDVHPRDAVEGDWETVKKIEGLRHFYPCHLGINFIDLGRSVTTRAIRLRITAAVSENDAQGHLAGKTVKGKRVWLAEFMALHAMGAEALEAALPGVVEKITTHPPIPVKFTLPEAGFVTLVIEDKEGKRVRNLVSETPFPKGDNIAWWDGTDDLGRDVEAAKHGLYVIPAQFVAPGDYRVRGLWRKDIHLFYEFGVYNNGNPPWNVPDHTGAWLANHGAPMSALFLPPGKSPTKAPALFLGAYITEGTDGIIWTDLNGKKISGRGWVGGLWTAAPYLARDDGPQADPKVQAYVASVGEGENKSMQLRVTGFSHNMSNSEQASFLLSYPAPPVNADWQREIGGLAVFNNMTVSSMTRAGKLIFADGKAGKLLGEVPLDNPRGSIFDPQGNLLILSGKTLLRFEKVQGLPLPPARTLVASGLEDPVGITLDQEGMIYISDRGQSHQVKVFTAEGKFVRAIGHPGVPKAGAYDPLHMNNPRGLAVDSNRHLWVAEEYYLPKRISEWTLEGNLVNAFYGPPKYGGGGTLDPQDKTRFYYADDAGTMEFKLDWDKGSFQLANVLFRPGADDLDIPRRFGSAPAEGVLYRETHHYCFFRQKQRYFTNCYNSNPTGGSSPAFIFKEENGVIHLVAGMGVANYWDILRGDAFKTRWPEGLNWGGQVFFIWSDLNGDGKVQPNEVTFQQGDSGGITIAPDVSFCVARYNGRTMRFAPVGFTEGGVPKYDLAKGQVLAEGAQYEASSGGSQALVDAAGNAVVTLGIGPYSAYSICGAKNGVATWSYPSPWPGLHASHESPPPSRPGQLIGTTRLLGGFIKPRGSDAGSVWAMTTSMGAVHLFTSDGLYVGTPFQDCRVSPVIAMPLAQRGMSLDNMSLNGENFWPTMTQTSDGKVFLVDGANSIIIRMEGLETIRRIPSTPLTVTTSDLKKAQDYMMEGAVRRKREQGGGVLHVALASAAPTVDGRLDDWNAAEWVEIDKSGTAAWFDSNTKPYDIRGAVCVADGKLFAAWKTGLPDLLRNSGEMPIAPFKTGGTLELMIAADPKADPRRKEPVAGDMRLTVTRVKDKTVAMLYRPVVPGVGTPKVPFSSPWRTLYFDQVLDVSDKVQWAADGKGNFEISIPLETLGFTPQPGMRIQGDIGILRGNGGQTLARTYWSNKATAIVSDVPSEAELLPSLWGCMEFESK